MVRMVCIAPAYSGNASNMPSGVQASAGVPPQSELTMPIGTLSFWCSSRPKK